MMLRGGHIPARGVRHRHTYLTERLYRGVLESELLLHARMSQLIAWAAIHSHPDADMSQAGQDLRVHYVDALSAVPYITQGKTGQTLLQQERLDFAKKYQDYKAKILQGRQIRPKRDKMAGITKVRARK